MNELDRLAAQIIEHPNPIEGHVLIGDRQYLYSATPAPTYAWVVDADLLYNDDPSIGRNEAGTFGPHDISPELQARLEAGEGERWVCYDDDGIPYYRGRIVGTYEGDEPLMDFAMPNAGAVRIEFEPSIPTQVTDRLAAALDLMQEHNGEALWPELYAAVQRAYNEGRAAE